MDYEAIVVGSGPAGAMAARTLARAGRSVLMLERDKLPRPKACGGGLTGNIRKVIDFDIDHVVENVVTRTYCVFRGARSILLEPSGLHVQMVQRDRFDSFLTEKAVEAGADLKDGTPMKKLSRDNGALVIETAAGTFRAQAVIGADGAASPTARAVGLRMQKTLGIAMDADLRVKPEQHEKWKDTAIFDFGIVPRGYGWSFPKGSFFSIGVGTVESHFPTARAHLDALIARHACLHDPVSMKIRSAPLPFWTHHETIASDGVFLAGDSAGLVDPLSGEGISYALRSGDLAGRFAAARLAGDASAEQGYNDTIAATMERGFQFALRLANVFFEYPNLTYHMGVRSQKVNDIFARLIAGDIDYVQLYDEVNRSLPGRAYRALKPLLKLFR